MKKVSRLKGFKLLCAALLLLGSIVILPLPAAKANYFNDLYNGLQKFSELPGEVNQLQESYQQTVEELQKTKDALGNAQDQMQNVQAQNAALQEQNRQLTQVVDELRDDRESRENYYNKIKVTIYTGIGLVVGYFVFIRLIRLGMRHRSRKEERLR
ncbi:hypothetical protein J7E73_26805 [Paenibacillus albidus]|uniref:DUF3450 domain-containing protein n=1 Tax=Paenibacillus albidus TaxID=2041023 RepID=UPI001BE8A712|nr:DUF3450 domain-containing protein [Paenibacillus albidus]MBT2292676.1 hypothetical protein [Paenibacillus albidus]